MLAKGVHFNEVLIDLQGIKPRWYSEVNPSGQTPCVRTAEGRVITEALMLSNLYSDFTWKTFRALTFENVRKESPHH